MITATSPIALEDIAAKVEAGERLSHEDGVRLCVSRDIHEIGRLANLVRERLHGDAAYYNVNRHINYTNYCVLRCKFCSFYRPYKPVANVVRRRRSVLAGRGTRENADSSRRFVRRPTSATGSYPEDATLAPRRQQQQLENRSIEGLSEDCGTGVSPVDRRPLTSASTDVKGRPEASATTDAEAVSEPFSMSLLDPLDFDAYELSVEQIADLAKSAYDRGATEVHIVGGLHPKLPFSYYLDMCRAIRAASPDIHIKAFTAIEIIHFTRIARPRLSIREVLEQLREAGLGSLPGGGAEIFDDRVHDEAYRAKVGASGWFDVHRSAHELGIYSNATMLYGHVERPEDRITHMIKVREHQDESLRSRRASFNCFIPLSFIPEGSEFAHLPGPTGLDDLKTLAISRLMLDNVPHIKAFWPMQSAKLAQVSLNWGVDDIDGTVVWYDITKREGGAGRRHQELTLDQLKRLIREAGRVPVERDTLYRPITREQNVAYNTG